MTLVVIGHFLRERFSMEQPFLTYSANLNLNVKVLDFVKSGGPGFTVGSTIFELEVRL